MRFGERELDSRFGGRESERLASAVEALFTVGAIAERLVVGQTATAQTNCGTASEIVRGAFGVDDREFPFNADGAVVGNRYFS